MDSAENHEEAKYLRQLVEAIDQAASRLTEGGVMELRRRVNTTSAIIRFVRRSFYQAGTIQKDLKRRKESRSSLFLLIGCLVVGGVLHYLFRDGSKGFDFTFGALVAVYGLMSYFLYQIQTQRMARELNEYQRQIDEMLYRWIAIGGMEDRFWQLRDQINLELGDLDMDTHAYRQWWYEMKADLLDSINGDTPGLGSWRPRSLNW